MKLTKLNLGCGMSGVYHWPGPIPKWVNVDHYFPPKIEAIHYFVLTDLNKRPWPFKKSTFSEIRAYHILEHLDNLSESIKEIHRIAQPKALIDIIVPYAGTLNDVANPAHKNHFNHRTFEYFCFDISPANDLDLQWRGFKMVSQHIINVGKEEFEGFSWQKANLQIILTAIK
jgi:hypothetical protein